MSVIYKDIDQLSQKLAVAGTEKIPISDTEYITVNQIAEFANRRIPIEYLESTGTQYINTGIVAASNFKCEIKGIFTQNDGNYDCVLGSSDVTVSPSRYSVALGLNPTNGAYLQFGANYASKTVNVLSLHTFITEKNGNTLSISVDGTTATATYSGSNPLTDIPIFVFARNRPNGVGSFAKFKLYYLKIWNAGILVRDYVPVRVGQIGYLEERLTGVLYVNIGSGNFTLGNDI